MSLLLALLTSAQIATGSPADASTSALDAVAIPGAVSVTGGVASSSTSALDAVAAPGSVSATGSVAESTTIAFDAVVSLVPVTVTGSVADATTSALDAIVVPAAVVVTGAVAESTTAALDATALPGAVTVTGAVATSTTSAFDAVAGFRGPNASTYTLALALPVRRVSASLPTRTLSLSVARRSLSVSIPARTLALSMLRRSLVSSVQSFTKGDTATPTFTLTIDSGTIAQPTSLAAQLYAVGSTTLTTSISVTPGDCAGWSSASVSVPVAFTSANTPAAGRYSVEIVATYADGTRRWPDNASAVQIEIKAPGAP